MGFGITIISAAYSHLLSGDGWMALDPLFFFAMLVTSYLTRSVRQGVQFRLRYGECGQEGVLAVPRDCSR